MGADALARAFHQGLIPKERLSPAEFGEKYREIVKSGRAGPYRISETPWARKVFWALSDESPFREIFVPKGTQLGFTEIGLIWIGEGATKGKSALVIEPTEATAKKVVKTKWREFIQNCEPLQSLFTGRAADTTLHFSAPSVDVIFAGSNSPANFASLTMARALADEFDRWAEELLKEGDPLTLLRNRLAVAGFLGKLMVPSSPTLVDRGIWPQWLLTDQQVFQTPCPKCGHMQQWLWDNIDWAKGKPSSVVLVCTKCSRGQTEYAWKSHWGDGDWMATAIAARPDITGFHLSSLYAMLGTRSWESIASEYEGYKALGQATNFQSFDNTVLGLPTKVEGETVPVDELRERLEKDLERGVIPRGGLVLVCAIDYQANRLEAFIWAFGRQLERWLVEKIVIPRMKPGPDGKDVKRSARELRDDILKQIQDIDWPHEMGGSLRVDMTIHDVADGPADVYDIIDLLPTATNIGSLGLEGRGKTELFNPAKPQDIRRDGVIVKHGRMRMSVNTYPAKSQWYADLRRPRADEGPSERFVHVPAWVDEEEGLLKQFVAEELRKSSRGKLSWFKTGRNEALDCAIMAEGGRWHLKTHKWPEEDWKRREARVTSQPEPHQPAQVADDDEDDAGAPGGWVNAPTNWFNRQ